MSLSLELLSRLNNHVPVLNIYEQQGIVNYIQMEKTL